MTDLVGQRLDNYHLIRQLGAGAFGEVYLGEQVYKKTQVAIKVLPPLSTDDLPIFLNEARIIRLKHPHIVHILDFGLDGRTPFLVMDLAPYGSLLQHHPRGTRLPLETVITYVKQIANALQYAHDERLIHRDIKPENLLVGPNHEVLVSDFGIVTMARSTRSLDTHNIAGTVAYMAPEQLQGKPCIASDQYALGIVVYEWLCGERPFKGSPIEIATQHLLASPPALREKFPMISLDAEKVIMKALSKDPHSRFASVQAFSQALEQAIAPPVGTVTCSYRGHTKSVTSLMWSPDSRYIISYDEDRVHVWEVTTGSKILTFEREHSYTSPYTSPLVAWSPNGKSIAFYTESKMHIWDMAERRQTFVSAEQTEKVDSIFWSTNGFHIVYLTRDYFEALKIWSIIDNRVVVCKGYHDLRDPTSSPDGKYIAAWWMSVERYEYDDYDWVVGGVVIWDTGTGDKVFEYYCGKGEPLLLTWSHDSRYIVSADGYAFQVWDVAKRQVIAQDENMSVHAISWPTSGKYIAYVEGNVHIRDTTTGNILLSYNGHTYWRNNALDYGAFDVVCSPDGKRIASLGCEINTIQVEDYTVQQHVWDATTGNNVVICRCQPLSEMVPPFNHMVVWSPDSRFIVSAIKNVNERRDCIVQVWDAFTGNIAYMFREHSDQVNALAWSPDGKYIASASEDKTVCVWVAPAFAL